MKFYTVCLLLSALCLAMTSGSVIGYGGGYAGGYGGGLSLATVPVVRQVAVPVPVVQRVVEPVAVPVPVRVVQPVYVRRSVVPSVVRVGHVGHVYESPLSYGGWLKQK